jgi:hypothetical protein
MKTAKRIPCRPATDEECRMIDQLRGIRTWMTDRRFASMMVAALDKSRGNKEPLEITDSQAGYIRRVHLCHLRRTTNKWGGTD